MAPNQDTTPNQPPCPETKEQPEHAIEVVILIGLQASGKTTFYNQRLAATHAHVSKDLMGRQSNREARQRRALETLLQSRQNIVVDNTNPSPEERAGIIEAARRYNARVVGYYFESYIPGCLSRNRAREGKSRVPDVALFATRKRLKQPDYDEGFDELYAVNMNKDGGFDVRPWRGCHIHCDENERRNDHAQ